MIRIKLQNNIGSFEVGGGGHKIAQLKEIAGIGFLAREKTSVTFPGTAGETITDIRDSTRTITMSFDFYAEPFKVEQLYRMLYQPVEILIFRNGDYRRKIIGQCFTSTDIQNIIFHRWQSIVLQFHCSNPYFSDIEDTTTDISAAVENRGDIEVYPVITVTNTRENNGTGSSYTLTITNNTTNKSIRLLRRLNNDDTFIFDFPKRKISSQKYGTITKQISDDTMLSDLFLALGSNSLTVSSSDASDVLNAAVVHNNNYISAVI